MRKFQKSCDTKIVGDSCLLSDLTCPPCGFNHYDNNTNADNSNSSDNDNNNTNNNNNVNSDNKYKNINNGNIHFCNS